MDRIIIEPKDQEEAQLIKAILKRLDIKSQYLSEEGYEDQIIANETIKGSKTKRVSESTITDYLKDDGS